MPLHRIYAPPGLFTKEEKVKLSKDITSMYTEGAGLPAFYVIVLFVDIEKDNFFIGGLNHAEREAKTGKPFVRIVSQHIARSQVEAEARKRAVQRLDSTFKVIKEKGYEYEMHIEEPPADMWLLNGMIPPAPKSDAEKRFAELDEAEPFKGQNIADYFQEKYPERMLGQ